MILFIKPFCTCLLHGSRLSALVCSSASETATSAAAAASPVATTTSSAASATAKAVVSLPISLMLVLLPITTILVTRLRLLLMMILLLLLLLLLHLHLRQIHLELLLRLGLRLHRRRLQRRGPLGVRAALALGPVRAEAREVKGAELAADVLLGADGPQRAEAHVVVRAGRQLGQRVDVQVEALLAVGAVAVAHEEVALGHAAEVVLVEELAGDALFAEAAQPVLADERVEAAGRVGGRLAVGDVALRAACAVGAAARLVGAANGPVDGEADLVGLAEEGGEGEGVRLRGVVEDRGGWAARYRRRRGGFCRHCSFWSGGVARACSGRRRCRYDYMVQLGVGRCIERCF